MTQEAIGRWPAPRQRSSLAFTASLLGVVGLTAACPGKAASGPEVDGGCAEHETRCTDFEDDDCDGELDCADADCGGAPCQSATCGAPGTCVQGACAQQPVPAGTVCRPVSGTCDVAESCTGELDCPTDEFLPEGTPCGPCSECDGSGGCVPRLDGTACGDGQACLNGACTTCGGELQPCCEGGCTGASLICEEGVCVDGSAPDAGPPPDGGGGEPDAGVAPPLKRTVVMAADIVEPSHTARARRVAGLISSHTPSVDFVTAGGDNARYPRESPISLLEFYRRYWSPATAANWGQFDEIIFPVPGNHEYNAPDAHGHFAYFANRLDAIAALGSYHGYANVEGKGYYSFDIAGWHFVALNSNCADVGGCGATSPQYAWLRGDLQRHAGMPIIAYFHHPPFWCKTGNPFAQNQTVRPFWNLLHDAGADFIFAGHTHFYQRFKPLSRDQSTVVAADRGVRLFIVGNSGVDTAPACNPPAARLAHQAGGEGGVGAFFLTLGRDGSYAFRYKTLDGTIVDSGSGWSRHRP